MGDELFSSLQHLSYRRKVASFSLLDKYFNGKFSDALHSLVRPVQTFTARFPHAKYTSSIHSHSLLIHFVWRNFHSKKMLLRRPRACFSNTTILTSSSKSSRHQSYITSYYRAFSPAFTPLQHFYLEIHYLKWRLGLIFGEQVWEKDYVTWIFMRLRKSYGEM